MERFLNTILVHPGLSGKDNRIFRIYNILLMGVIAVVAAIGFFLLSLDIQVAFWICMAEVVIYCVLLRLHIAGYIYSSRYIFFVFTIAMQVVGSLFHGETGGYDFLFFSTALSPVLFFEKRWQYFSLFVLSMGTYIAVKHLYSVVEPIFVFDEAFSPYYVNMVISALLVYYGYVLFKREHLKYEEELKEQRDQIIDQHGTLENAQKQMQQLLEARTKQVEAQNDDILKYADINAHIVRSPLARILGLTNLAKYEDLQSEEVRQYYIEQLQHNANDLDQALRDINILLSKHTD